ncbi:MAG: site-2 protease family protein, partial [Coriobacteriia bacterium]|nr:site-2 protease family protein [Coriobacteriia bacterium]
MELLANMPSGVAATFWGIVTFSLLVVIHEGGHFLAARFFGVKIHEFMVGLPGPAIRIKSERSGTSYGITAIPLGGYVRIAGMEPGAEDPLLGRALALLVDRGRIGPSELADELAVAGVDHARATALLTTLEDYCAAESIPDWPESRSLVVRATGETDETLLARIRRSVYRGQPTWKRITILCMGVLFNLLAAILIFTVILTVWGYDVASMRLSTVVAGSAAEKAGLKVGDRITALDGTPVTQWEELLASTSAHKPGDTLAVTVQRSGATIRFDVVLGASTPGHAFLGVGPAPVRKHFTVLAAARESIVWTGMVFVAVAQFFNPATFASSIGNARSVVGISYEVAQAVKSGPLDYA